jgi:hypothetical protein
MGIAFFGKEDPYRRNVRAFLTDVKLHLASRTQAALYALRSGLASIDDVPAAE